MYQSSIWLPERSTAISPEHTKGKVSFDIDLGLVGSALFAVTETKPEEQDSAPPSGRETVVEGIGELTVKRESENVLMVNYLDLKTAKSARKDVYFMNP